MSKANSPPTPSELLKGSISGVWVEGWAMCRTA